MTEPSLYATAAGGRRHLRECPHLLGKQVEVLAADDPRPICDGCQKEVAGFGRTYFDDLDSALEAFQAPTDNRPLIKQHLANVTYDQIWMPYSSSYIALGRGGRGVAWTGKTYVVPSAEEILALPGFAPAAHGGGCRIAPASGGRTAR